MSGIWSWIYQLVLLVAATFAFVVLFQYGTTDFARHANEEFHRTVALLKGGSGDSSARE